MKAIIDYKDFDKSCSNEVSLDGKLVNKFKDVDINGKPFYKLVLLHTDIAKKDGKKHQFTAYCFCYNKQFNIINSNGFKINDLINISGSLQERNARLTIFVKNIKKYKEKEM